MQRREFLSTSVAAVAGTCLTSPTDIVKADASTTRLRFAARAGMFKHLGGQSISEQIAFAASQGFTAFENRDLLVRAWADIERSKIDIASGTLESIDLANWSRELSARGMVWGAASVAEEYGRSLLEKEARFDFAWNVAHAMQTSRRVSGFNRGVVVPGRLPVGTSRPQHLHDIAEMLKPFGELAEKHRFTFLFEPRGPLAGSTPMLVETIEHAVELCERIGSPTFNVLYDVYEQSMNGRDLSGDLQRYQSHIGYLHIGDAPGNKEPGTGTVAFVELLAQLREQQFNGIIGLDHGHSRAGVEGEIAVLEGYRRLMV
ncbi:MAG: TIM barrel protein [Planctomycetota bacterium]|nr:TIM barrel protein [Planctomycetota bacterium]MDA1212487.1 TIM barrel protein [Planctomycetota bacterium]